MKIPPASSPHVKKVMQANTAVDSLIELRLRSLVHKSGLRYSIDSRPVVDLNRRADLVFRSAKVAVFIHGCYWHGCRWHFKTPKSNRKFWQQKISNNRKRDADTRARLRRMGWEVVTYWEHQNLDEKAIELIKLVRFRRRNLLKKIS